ncbi:hypothetical protein Bca52824_093666 [Brassica carinata]|uniref:ARM repeat superfamily protein n=1 Tax=Brassica carinata TaxID=52824 RepID=A0A8X7P228_BRACI|nr:hypothetical protein Bca52824_093666 [Brassica carinata]
MKFINIVTEAYNNMLFHCKDQIATCQFRAGYTDYSWMPDIDKVHLQSAVSESIWQQCQWTPPNGLAMIVLSEATYLMETSGSQQLVLSSVIRHLDNKHVANDPELKAYIIQVAGCLAKLIIRTSSYLRDISFVNDLCRHLRKSFQAATSGSIGEEELNLNSMLQNSIEDCLQEIAKEIGNTQPLFDMMAVLLEGLPSSGAVSRAAVGSLLILTHAMSTPSMRSQQAFADTLLDALLKAMLHPDVEIRVGAHEMFSEILLLPNSGQSQAGLASVRSSGYLKESRNLRSDTASYGNIFRLLTTGYYLLMDPHMLMQLV